MRRTSHQARDALNVIQQQIRQRDDTIHILRSALIEFHEFVQNNLEAPDEPNHPIDHYLNWHPENLAALRKALKR